MSDDGRGQRTEVRETATPGRWMVIYDGGVIGHVEQTRTATTLGGRPRRRSQRWAVSGQPGDHRHREDAVAHLVRIHRGPR